MYILASNKKPIQSISYQLPKNLNHQIYLIEETLSILNKLVFQYTVTRHLATKHYTRGQIFLPIPREGLYNVVRSTLRAMKAELKVEDDTDYYVEATMPRYFKGREFNVWVSVTYAGVNRDYAILKVYDDFENKGVNKDFLKKFFGTLKNQIPMIYTQRYNNEIKKSKYSSEIVSEIPGEEAWRKASQQKQKQQETKTIGLTQKRQPFRGSVIQPSPYWEEEGISSNSQIKSTSIPPSTSPPPNTGASVKRTSEEVSNNILVCSKCGNNNPQSARFCNSCGARLPLACTKCGNINPEGSAFCNKCGNAITGINYTDGEGIYAKSQSPPDEYLMSQCGNCGHTMKLHTRERLIGTLPKGMKFKAENNACGLCTCSAFKKRERNTSTSPIGLDKSSSSFFYYSSSNAYWEDPGVAATSSTSYDTSTNRNDNTTSNDTHIDGDYEF